MERKVIVIRHGQTQWNVLGKQQGHKGSPLTEKGYHQANQVAESVKVFGINHLFTSPLERAIQTALAISQKLNLEPKVDSRLMECSFGLCEGLTRTDINYKYPDLYDTREKNKWNFQWPEGESYADVYKRIDNFVSECLFTNSYETCGIVTHETTIKVLIGKLLNLPQQEIMQIKCPNSVIYYFGKNGKVKYMDVSETPTQCRTGLIYKTNEEKYITDDNAGTVQLRNK